MWFQGKGCKYEKLLFYMNVFGCKVEVIIRFFIVKAELKLIYSVFVCFLILSNLAHSVD
jgi:hypothetical protein